MSTPMLAPRPFVLVGVAWRGPRGARIELRVRTAAGWSRWALASSLGHDGDHGVAARGLFGEPIWTGPADCVQIRASTLVDGLSLHFVELETSAPRRSSQAAAAGAPPLVAPSWNSGGGQPPILARRAWDRGDGPGFPPGYGSVQLAFVHHTDSPNGYSPAQVPAMIRSIYLYHRYVRGWNDIGYNFLIDASGRIWEGRAGGVDLPVAGAHAGGYNLESTGVALLGTFAVTLPSAPAQSALTRLLAWKLSLHGIPSRGKVTVEVDPGSAGYTPFSPGQQVSLPRVAGHRDGCTTDCPGSDLYRRLRTIRPAVAALATDVATLTIALQGGRLEAASFLSLAGSELLVGAPLTVSGRLTSLAGAPVAAAPVLLQSISTDGAGEASEQVLASLSTAVDGSWTTQLIASANLLLRATYAGPPAVVSPLVWAAVAPTVTLMPVPSAPAPTGGLVHLEGTVTPARSKMVLIAQRTDRRHAKSVRHTVAVTGGQFSCRLRLHPGSWRVWAESFADARYVAGSSARLMITV